MTLPCDVLKATAAALLQNPTLQYCRLTTMSGHADCNTGYLATVTGVLAKTFESHSPAMDN